MTIPVYRNLWWNVGPVKVVIADVPYSLPAAQWELPPSSTIQIIAYPTGMGWTYDTTPPYPGEGVSLFIITTDATKIIGVLNTQTAGGSGGNNLLSPSSVFNGLTGTTITLIAEGVAQVKATITVNLQQAGFTPDQSIRSYELSWAIAGTNQWHPGATIAYAPDTYTVTGYIHGLAGGESYDIGFQARAHDGTATPPAPVLVTTASPSITGASITQVLAAGSVSWKQLHGDTSGDTSTPIVDGSNKRLLHTAMSASVQSVINSSGQIPTSTALNAQGSIPPFTTTAVVNVNTPSSATYATVFVTSGGSNPIFYRSDGTNVSAPALSSSTLTTIAVSSFPTSTQANANGIKFTGLVTGNTYYFLVYFNVNTGYWTITINSVPFTPDLLIVPYQDSYAVLLASATLGAYTAGGGGGSTGGCPAVGQIIETKERGFVKAETLRKGEHLRDWTGGWNEVINDPGTREAQIWEVCFDTETIRVDASHMFDTTGEGRWVNVKDLISGDFLPAYPPGSGQVRVESVKCCGMGEFVYILCERSRYVLGHTISHNVHMKN